MKNEKYIEVAINLSRMYGVAETLEPLQPKKFIEFDKMIDYIENDDMDGMTVHDLK